MPVHRRRDRFNSKRFRRASVRYLREVAGALRAALVATAKPQKQSEKAVHAIARTAAERTLLIARLLRERRDHDAAVLARTLIDLALTGAYLTQPEGIAREHLSSRFMGFEPVQLRELLRRHSLGDVSARMAAYTRQVAGVFRGIEEKQHLGWAGLCQDQMVRTLRRRDIRELIRGLRTRSSFILSAFVHPTPMGVEAVAEWGALVLPDIAWSSAVSLLVLGSCLGEVGGDVEDVMDVFEKEMDRFEAERRRYPDDAAPAPLPLFEWRSARAGK